MIQLKSKKILKLFGLLIAFALLVNMSFANGVSAAPVKEQGTLLSKTVVNEYDKFKEIQSKSDEELLKKGYSNEDLKAIRSIDYKDELKKRVDKEAKLDKDTLKAMGYTEDQIHVIYNYTGEESQVYALSAELWLSTYVLSYSKSSSLSQASLRTDWTWTQRPVWLETDILAAIWSEGMYVQSGSQTFGKANYYYIDYGTFKKTNSISVTPNLNVGASIKIPMALWETDGNAWAKTGEFGYKITRQSLVEELSVHTDYGHNEWTVSPTVTFGPFPGLTFSYSVFSQATNDVYIDL